MWYSCTSATSQVDATTTTTNYMSKYVFHLFNLFISEEEAHFGKEKKEEKKHDLSIYIIIYASKVNHVLLINLTEVECLPH